MGDLARAEEEWRLVTREVPHYRAGWHGLGDVLIRNSRGRQALSVAEHCLSQPRLRVVGHLLRSRLALAAGDITAAQAEVDEALAEAPTDRAALEVKCQLLFDHGPPSTAEAALRSLVKYYPDDASGHHNLGTLLLQFKRYDEAVRSLRQALRHRADAPATYLHLGFALKESGRIDEAVAAWQQVLRLAPNDPTARAELKQAALSASRTNVELSLRR
jgi:tetratricopeptide (TPR) repeat protein